MTRCGLLLVLISLVGLQGCASMAWLAPAEHPPPARTPAQVPAELGAPPPLVTAPSDALPPDADPALWNHLWDSPELQASPNNSSPSTSSPSSPEEVDDGLEDPSAELDTPATATASRRHPWADLNDREFEQRLLHDPASLGPMSIGRTNAGMLYNGVQMPRGDQWELMDPNNAWGTQETIDALIRCIRKVNEQFPDSQKMYVGHISSRRGGHLSPHISHQAGRDVDVSYYMTVSGQWYARATDSNLDRARTWAFVKALAAESDVEMILIDRSIQLMLKDYALRTGENRDFVESLFEFRSGSARPLVRHAKGHATHIHVRFYNPIAEETGRRAYSLLMKYRKAPAVRPANTAPAFVAHTVRDGETIALIAKRYGVSVQAILQANGLRTGAIHPNQVYRIPRQGASASASQVNPQASLRRPAAAQSPQQRKATRPAASPTRAPSRTASRPSARAPQRH